jgi:hypothetical protein
VVSHIANKVKIVRHEYHGHAPLPLQLSQQGDNLGLYGNIKRRSRLISDQEARLAGECRRDHDTLPHSSRELVWEGIDPAARIRDSDETQQFDRTLTRRVPRQTLMNTKRLSDLITDGKDRIEARHWILKDHRDLAPADLCHVGFASSSKVNSATITAREPDLATGDLGTCTRQQPHDC